jgi:undecaprenyl-diphosphatase
MRQKLLKEYTIYLIAGMAVLLAILIYLVYYHPVSHIDVTFSRDFQAEGDTALRKSLMSNIFRTVSLFGTPIVAVLIVISSALLFWLLKFYREAAYVILTAISTPVDFIMKNIINRPRPTSNLVNVIDNQASPSFPSGHVVFFTVFFGFLIVAMIVNRKINIYLRAIVIAISSILIVLISFSRVYLGAHWVSDVIGGYLVGFIVLFIISYLYLLPIIKKMDAKSPK